MQDVVIPMSAGLRGKLPDSIALPASVTVPFGSFEEALAAPANKAMYAELQEAIALIPTTGAEPALANCREIVMKVHSTQYPIAPHHTPPYLMPPP